MAGVDGRGLGGTEDGGEEVMMRFFEKFVGWKACIPVGGGGLWVVDQNFKDVF